MQQTRSFGFSSQSNYPAGGRSSFDSSQRYERALKRVEQLSYAVVAMSIVLIILII